MFQERLQEKLRAYRAGWMKGACGYDTDANDQRNRALRDIWDRGHADGLAAREQSWRKAVELYC